MTTPATPPEATLHGIIAQRGRETPGEVYLVVPETERTLTCAELLNDCTALGLALARAGLRPGDTVSVFLPNGEQTTRLLLGIMANGLIANPVNLLCQPAQIRYILDHSDTRLVFTSPENAGAIRTALADIRRHVMVIETHADSTALPELPAQHASSGTHGGAPALPPPTPEQDALLMYTSGTTGVPKGVLLTHRNLLANGDNISREHRLTRTDRVLASLPLYHINGLVVTAIAPLCHGGSLVMPARFSTGSFWQHATRFGCTWINVVPTMIAYLLNDNPDAVRGLDLSRLRFCRSASAALPPEHHRAFEQRFGIGIIETMGMTETAAPSFSNPYDSVKRKIGSIGRPSGTEARVIGPDGRVLGPNETGEIVIRGSNIMRGYYKAPEQTRAAFTEDGWLRTGDLGYRDDDGYYFINGRAKELIIKGGENIAPREIDEALLRHPAVLEAAAVGVPDPAYGQDIVAYVVRRDSMPCDDAELRTHCLRELGRYKTPREFRFINELPRGPSGKVQRLKLLAP